MKIKYKLPLIMFISSIIPMLIAGIVYYFTISGFSSDIYYETLKNSTSTQSVVLDSTLLSYTQATQALSEMDNTASIMKIYSSILSKDIEDYFRNTRREVCKLFSYRTNYIDNLEEVYLVATNGVVLASSNEIGQRYLYIDRSIYNLNEPAIITDGRISDGDGRVKDTSEEAKFIYAVSPIVSDDKTLGYVIQKYNIDIANIISENVSFGHTGHAFVINKLGDLVTGSSDTIKNYISTLLENNIDSELTHTIKAFFSDSLDKKSGIIFYKFNGEEMCASYSLNKSADWLIFTSMSKSEIFESTITSTAATSVSLFIISLVILGIGFMFSYYITKPIDLLKNQLIAASNGDYSVSLNIKEKNEFGELSVAFNEMMGNVDKAFKDLRIAEKSIKETKEKYEIILNGSRDCLCEWNIKTCEFYVNNKWTHITGRPVPKIIDIHYLANLASNEEDSAKLYESLTMLTSGKMPTFSETFQCMRTNGDTIWLYFRGALAKSSMSDNDVLVASLSDITELKSTQALVEELAAVDHMTHLVNLSNISSYINDYLHNHKSTSSAVVIIGINNLTAINERYGFKAGNEIIKAMAERLRNLTNDDIILAKGEGDTFIMLMQNIQTEAEVDMLSHNAVKLSELNIQFESNIITSTASAGASIAPKDASSADELLKYANIALNSVKVEKQAEYKVFSPSMLLSSERKSKISDLLVNCIEDGSLSVYLQPEYDSDSNKIRCFEALLRLRNDELGNIPPSEFIPIAEENGLIVKISNWLIEHICLTVNDFKRKGFNFESISINISLAHIIKEDFFPTIRRILTETGVNPNYIDFEFTESILLNSVDLGKDIISRLKSLGIRVVLDDFGSGYSSLNYLRTLDIDTLKIDKEFIDEICDDANDAYIVETIINLAHKMGIDVVAEGVETREQLDTLKALNCDMIQGFYFSRPIPEDEVQNLKDIK